MSIRLFPILLIALWFAPGPLAACDADGDCGLGGTCIKREKRARGVCYGGDLGRSESTQYPLASPPDPLSVPAERPKDACMVTQECPAGMQCVIAGVWGRCLVL